MGDDTEGSPPIEAPSMTPPPMPSVDAGGGEPEAAAESFKVEKDLPLILENKGIHLPDFELMSKKANLEIDKINKEIDNLVKD